MRRRASTSFSPRLTEIDAAHDGAGAKRAVATDQEILHHGEMREQFPVLKSAADAELRHFPERTACGSFAVQQYFAAMRVINAVDAVEHSGFAGAIRADHRDQFRRRNFERHRAQGVNAAEAERHVFHSKSSAGLPHPHHRRLRLYWRMLR
jgi:hypothetical protein